MRIREIIGATGVLVAAASVVGTHRPASADTQVFTPAAQCMWSSDIHDGQALTAGELVSTSPVTPPWIICGLDPAEPAEGLRNVVDVYYTDRKTGEGFGNNVRCSARRTLPDDSSGLFLGTRYGCAASGGCSSDPGEFTGSGFVRFTGFEFDRAVHKLAVDCRVPRLQVIAYPGGWPPTLLRSVVHSFVWSTP